jgi:hypothetical protein
LVDEPKPKKAGRRRVKDLNAPLTIKEKKARKSAQDLLREKKQELKKAQDNYWSTKSKIKDIDNVLEGKQQVIEQDKIDEATPNIDWDAYEDSSFPEFNREIHVLENFDIPNNWMRFRAADWGYSSPACCLWFAVDHDNVMYVYRELYIQRVTADEFAKKVLELEYGEYIRYGVLDSSTWANRGDIGPSIAETMIKEGCRWRPSDRSPRSRINGKIEIHKRLKLNENTNEPTLYILNNCKNLLRTLPMLPLDKNNSEDVDTKAEDHAYDALRYGCMSRPI